MNRPKDINAPSPWNMRIWDVDNGRWLGDGHPDDMPYYGFDIRGGEVAYVQGMQWVYRYSMSEGHPLIWERSTGLTDKNGVEIYEGDIIKTARSYGYGFLPRGAVATVVFDKKELCYKLKSRGEFRLTANKVVEVIGNIHENPELLKGEENNG